MTNPVKPQTLISAKNITIRVYDRFLFHNTSWEMQTGEHWLIVGPNGAGKTTFAKALAGLLPLKFGEIVTSFSKKKIKYIAFESEQQYLHKQEQQEEFASYIGIRRKGKTVRAFLGKRVTEELIAEFGIPSLLGREVTRLSTGEMRKVFIVKTLLTKPKLLILDEPFNGLDIQARHKLNRFLDKITKNLQIILITHYVDEIPKCITHEMVIDDGKITYQTPMNMSFPRRRESSSLKKQFVSPGSPVGAGDDKIKARVDKENVIEMKNVSVQFGRKKVLQNVNWTVRKGENWAILGPNGAGKSTLVKLITGDSLQVHANDIKIFGKHRDELTLWDIRKNLGYVSSETHLQEKQFNHLSQGQKRMRLIEREFQKSPKLLILDEPCQHLDQENRKHVLQLIDTIGKSEHTNILLITHHVSEIVPSISHVLQLENGKADVVQ